MKLRPSKVIVLARVALSSRTTSAALALGISLPFGAGCNTASSGVCEDPGTDSHTQAHDAGAALDPSSGVDPNWIGEWWRDVYDPLSFQNSAFLMAEARCACLSFGVWPDVEGWRWGDDERGREDCEAELEQEDWWVRRSTEDLEGYEADERRLYALACITVERGAVAECFQDMLFERQCDYDAYLACQAELDSVEERCGGYEW